MHSMTSLKDQARVREMWPKRSFLFAIVSKDLSETNIIKQKINTGNPATGEEPFCRIPFDES